MFVVAALSTISIPMIHSPLIAVLVALVIVIAGVRALIRLGSAFVVG